MVGLGGRKIAIVGMGSSGLAAARLCLARGAEVTGFDEAPLERLDPAARPITRSGPLAENGLAGFDLVVVSPGVPDNAAIAAAERSGVEVIGELELAYRCLPADVPVVLIGGTNGKSTVTSLVGAMLAAAGKRAFVGGNLGTPFSEAASMDVDVAVVEISSFQAERVPTLHARAAALLNLSEDHLDRYPSFEAYARAKGNPFAAMTAEDVAIVPAGDDACARQAARGAARRITFSPEVDAAHVSPDATGAIADRLRGFRHAPPALSGRHNVANACAAIALVSGLSSAGAVDVPPGVIDEALAGFQGLPHRTVLVAEIGGVRFYDDSKGTNVGASVAALRGLDEERAVLIAGGRDKRGDYRPLVEALAERGRALVVIGEAADRIAAAAGAVLPVSRAASLAEAVGLARDLARPGDAVLLSPACSSYDMFANYKVRGEAFARAVHALEEAR